jgi:CRP-like cAMP-binding protein
MCDNELRVVRNFKTGDRILPARTQLYRPGEESTELYNLLDGWIALYRVLESGQRQVLDIAMPGAFLGYQPDLDKPMLHGAECITDVAVCVFPRRAFPQLITQHPAMASRLIWLMANDVALAQERLTNVGSRTGMERVARFLLEIFLRARPHEDAKGRRTVELPLTQELIGDTLSLTPVHVNRVLRRLRESGLVTLRNGILHIVDLDGLTRFTDMPALHIVASENSSDDERRSPASEGALAQKDVEPPPLLRRSKQSWSTSTG